MHRYKPDAEPTAEALSPFGRVLDVFEKKDEARWAKASGQPSILKAMVDDIGVYAGVEVDGDLYVEGDFNVFKHKIAALWSKAIWSWRACTRTRPIHGLLC